MPFQTIKTFTYVAGLLVSLTSCQLDRDATITVVGKGAMPEFDVKVSDGETCINSLTVYTSGSNDRILATFWRVDLIWGRGDADCQDRLTYGQTPRGYETDTPAKPLVTGKRYRVQAHGTGWTVTTDWTPR